MRVCAVYRWCRADCRQPTRCSLLTGRMRDQKAVIQQPDAEQAVGQVKTCHPPWSGYSRIWYDRLGGGSRPALHD